MRITFLGHVGLHVETEGGAVLCDPWFTPAYFGSWFPFPRNDHLDVAPLRRARYLYVSHLHHDHFDPEWLRANLDPSVTVLLPDFRYPALEHALQGLGFERFVRTREGEPVDLDGCSVTIFAMNAPADGPLGDSAIVIADDRARILDQNDARPGEVGPLQALGPYAAHFVQFSGAIWYPMAYDFPPAERERLGREKRRNQMERARRYVEWIGAAQVFPVAGPPCFLDPELFALNDLDDDPANIFPDQRVFLAYLENHGIDTGRLIVPGSTVELADGVCEITHPADAERPFTDKRAYLEGYRADWSDRLAAERAGWSTRDHDLLAELREWFEPLLAAAPRTSAGVAGTVVLDTGDLAIAIDFVAGIVRDALDGEPAVYRVEVDRRLLEACVERRHEDWVNSLFLSCRFRAHREGPFNEYVMSFFKSLSPERMAYVESCYAEQHASDEMVEIDGWRVQRRCPHRRADLARFGSVADGVLTCALHHWQFDLETGRCLTSDDVRLVCERADAD